MLPVLVIACLASAQVWGAVIVPSVSDSYDASDDANFRAKDAHSDGDGHLVSSSKDYEYAYDRAGESAHNDYAANQVQDVNGLGYLGNDHAASSVEYNNDYSASTDVSSGKGHEENLDHQYRYNNDDALLEDNAAVAVSENHNVNGLAAVYPSVLHKRSLGYHYGHHYAGHPFVYKRSAGFLGHHFPGHPFVYKRSVGYLGHHYAGHPFVYKRSVGYLGHHYAGHPFVYKRSIGHFPYHTAGRPYVHKRSVAYGYPGYRYFHY